MKKLLLSVSLVCAFVCAPVVAEEPDGDHDGVPDSIDKCPDTAQLKKLPPDFKYAPAVNPERLKPGPQAYPVGPDGCEPDTDGDGVVDSQDYCPDDSPEAISKGVGSNGCPVHTDGDGTPDYRDDCPGTPRGVPTDAQGCPKEGATGG